MIPSEGRITQAEAAVGEKWIVKKREGERKMA